MEKITLIHFENEKYECKIDSTDKQNININVENNGFLKFKGSISLQEIYSKIPLFKGYSMEELFSVINDLKEENFAIIKESDKFIFDIAFKVLKKEKHLPIIIKEVSESINDMIKKLLIAVQKNNKKITELENLIKEIKQKNKKNKDGNKEKEDMNEEEEEEEDEDEKEDSDKEDKDNKDDNNNERENKKEIEDNFDLNVNIEDFSLSDLKYDKTIFNYESSFKFSSLIILKDGRIAVGRSLAPSIKESFHPTGISIFDKDNFKEVIFIKDLGPEFIELKNENLLTHQEQLKVHIIKLKNNSFDILQTLNFDNKIFPKLVELANGVLSIIDNTNKKILFYKKENNKYLFDYDFKLKSESRINLEGNKNELIYSQQKKGKKKLTVEFFNYESKTSDDYYIVKVEMDELGIVQKVSKNLFVIANKNEITFYDYREKCSKFLNDIKDADGISGILGICSVNETDILLSFKLSGPEVSSRVSLFTIYEEEGEEKEEKEEKEEGIRLRDRIPFIEGEICNLAVTKDFNLIYCNTDGIIKMKYK